MARKSFATEYMRPGGLRDQLRSLARKEGARGFGTDKPVLHKGTVKRMVSGSGHAGHVGSKGPHRGHGG